MSTYKYYSKDDALEVLKKYWVYQDRCHSEVRTRLIKLKIYGDDLEDIIVDLIEDDFLNEERFAKAYVNGKFKIKKWGKIKIRQELKFRKISDYSLRKAFEEIDYDDYLNTLINLFEKKNATLRAKDIWDRRKKLTAYAQQKGYEYDIIKEAMESLNLKS